MFRETERLEDAGLIVSERVGNVRLVRPNSASPFYEELKSLLLKAFGPAQLLGRLLANVEGVQAAYLFGSWARLYAGEPSRAPGDLDVLVVGEPDLEKLYERCQFAESRLGLEVNPTVVSPATWEDASSSFVRTVPSRPLVEIPLADLAVARRLAAAVASELD